MNFLALEKHFESELDQFLVRLSQTVPESRAQEEEIEKFRRIAKLRDEKNTRQESL